MRRRYSGGTVEKTSSVTKNEQGHCLGVFYFLAPKVPAGSELEEAPSQGNVAHFSQLLQHFTQGHTLAGGRAVKGKRGDVLPVCHQDLSSSP